jgi:hypothetical protein
MGQQGFRTLNSNPYVYQEIDAGASVAYGVDTTSNLVKIRAQATVGATPTGTGNITINPAAVGNVTLTGNGAAGRVVVSSNFTVSAGTVVLTPLAAARPCTVRSSTSGQLSMLLDSNVDGQLLISSNAGTPIWASLTAGAGISVTPGHNSITIAASGGVNWAAVPGNTIALVADGGYMLDNGALTTATLPLTCAVGETIRLIGSGTGLFLIAQNAGQSIKLGNVSSTVGVMGDLSSSSQYDSIELLCIVADTVFAVLSSVGNFTLS